MARIGGHQINAWYYCVYWAARLVARLLFRFRMLHRERMINEGPAILASNHQSYLDPPLVGNAANRPIFFLARKTLLDVPVIGRILPKLNVIPVDQEGSDRSALKAIIRVLKTGEAALVFPEGARTLDGNLQPALPGVGLVIAKTLAPVVPMRIFGADEALPRGSSRLRLRPITVVVGQPIRFTEADLQPSGKDLYQRLSNRVMEAIAALKAE
jgi:1-acyl-sn-glycerol-3-phosphate acyltransferase